MFLVEASVFVLFVGGFCTWLLLSERLVDWRDDKDSQRVNAFVLALRGLPIADVVMRLGPPREHFQGSSGKSLYVWQRPPSNALPRVRGLLVLTVTVNPEGRVEGSVWQRR